MSSLPEVDTSTPRSSSGLAAATDARGLAWPIQAAILFGYLAIAAIAAMSIPPAQMSIALAAAAVAWLLQWGALWLLHRSFLSRTWWRRHAFWSAVMVLSVIVITAILTAAVAGSASATDGWTVLWRWGITVLVTSLAVLSIDYRADVQTQRERQEQLLDARARGVDEVMTQRGEVVMRMLAMLQEAVGTATRHSASSSDAVKGFAREQVRPLSHELMNSLPVIAAPRMHEAVAGWREVLSRITAVPLIRPWLMAAAVTVLFVFTTVETTSDGQTPAQQPGQGVTVTVDIGSLLISLFLLVLVFGSTWISSWVMLRATRGALPRLSLGRRVAVVMLTPLVIVLVVEVVVQLAYVVPGFNTRISSNLVDRLWLAAPIVIVAFALLVVRVLVVAITSTRHDLQRTAEDLAWENSRLRNSMGQERRFFATQLHGPIQSVATAAALRLESFDSATDRQELLAAVEDDLTGAIEQLAAGPPERRDVSVELANIASTWVGVCQVHVDIPDSIIAALDADWVSAGTAMDVLIDAVANAAMHGRATNVWIVVQWNANDEVGITVTNDGSTDFGSGRGLGSALLDESCVRWAREVSAGAVALSCAIAIPQSAVRESELAYRP